MAAAVNEPKGDVLQHRDHTTLTHRYNYRKQSARNGGGKHEFRRVLYAETCDTSRDKLDVAAAEPSRCVRERPGKNDAYDERERHDGPLEARS